LATVGVSHGEVGFNKTILENVQVEPVFTLANSASLAENEAPNFTIWTSNHELFVNLTEVKNLGKCSVIDQSGRLVQTQSTLNSAGILSFKNLSSGFYLVQLEDTKGNLIAAKKTLIP
jgi:hypothetical protein